MMESNFTLHDLVLSRTAVAYCNIGFWLILLIQSE